MISFVCLAMMYPQKKASVIGSPWQGGHCPLPPLTTSVSWFEGSEGSLCLRVSGISARVAGFGATH